jgi:hypothetical protein
MRDIIDRVLLFPFKEKGAEEEGEQGQGNRTKGTKYEGKEEGGKGKGWMHTTDNSCNQ